MNTPIRKYTPPTCTLEIRGTGSPLAVWTKKDLLADTRFELRIDDPRLPEEHQISLRGDRTRLQLLREIVDRYVQDILSDRPESPPPDLPSLPYLQRRGLLEHELFFGSLVAADERASIRLTTSQLFDLASSLEEYASETELLPRLIRRRGRRSTLLAAGAALATLGLLGGGIFLGIQMTREPETAAENPIPSPVAGNLPALPLPPTGKIAPSPRVPLALGNKAPLPPPPAAGTLPAPPRVASVPLVVPPRPYLPPPPTGNVDPSSGAIVIQPREPGAPITAPPAPPSDRANAPESVSPTTMNPTPSAPKLPRLPALPAPAPENTTPRPEVATAPNTNLLDTIPQVAQTREYFQARWKPPESLKQTLEYRLVLNQDGSLQQIIPLGQAAKIYIDRTGMPLLNEPFVSPLDIAGNPRLRLVLVPDGTVKTLMEQ